MEVSSKRSAFWYSAFNLTTTIGSIIVPALISIQDRTFQTNATDLDQDVHENAIYWATWGVFSYSHFI